MAARNKPPFRAEHVGSLLRPPELRQARADHRAGRIAAEALRGIEDKVIRRVVARQEELGLQAVTDGELRRDSWHMDFYRQIGGLVERGAAPIRLKNAQAEIE
jgi:5-methyltetrahydropteroyltriglutamate--homocysteine methyltransferase